MDDTSEGGIEMDFPDVTWSVVEKATLLNGS